MNLFPNTKVYHLISTHADHLPILLKKYSNSHMQTRLSYKHIGFITPNFWIF